MVSRNAVLSGSVTSPLMAEEVCCCVVFSELSPQAAAAESRMVKIKMRKKKLGCWFISCWLIHFKIVFCRQFRKCVVRFGLVPEYNRRNIGLLRQVPAFA